MKITLLGTGTPTNPTRFQSSVVVEIGDDVLLFDAGRGTVHQMYQAGIAVQRVNPVFITHHHFDHINDLFDVIISTAMQGRTEPLQIFGPAGTHRIVQALLEQVYAADIRFRLEEDRAVRQAGGSWGEQPQAISHITGRDVGAELVVATDNWRVTADFVQHGTFPNAPDFQWRCLGYRIESAGRVVTISGDTVPCDGVVRLAQDADLLIQCCHMPQSAVNNPVMQYLADDVIASSTQAGIIAAAANVKRMVLTHLSATIHQGNFDEILADVRQSYAGEVLLGEDLLVLHLPPA